MTKTTLDILRSGKRLESANEEVLSLKTSIDEKKGEVEYKKTNDFIEEKARNELNMILLGEKVFVANDTSLVKDDPIVLGTTTDNVYNDSNVYHWYKLFF